MRGVLANRLRTAETTDRAAQGQSVSRKTVAEVPLAGLSLPPGQDGSLDMRLEVALRGDLVGQTPVLGRLIRTPLIVPLKGTVEKPQFDAAAMESILGRIVENTAEAVLKDGIGRGLEAVFGQPQPPDPTPARPQP